MSGFCSKTNRGTHTQLHKRLNCLVLQPFSLYGGIHQLFNLLYLINIRINNCNLCWFLVKYRYQINKDNRFALLCFLNYKNPRL